MGFQYRRKTNQYGYCDLMACFRYWVELIIRTRKKHIVRGNWAMGQRVLDDDFQERRLATIPSPNVMRQTPSEGCWW